MAVSVVLGGIMESDSSLTEGSSGKLQWVTNRTNGSAVDDSITPSGPPRGSAQDRAGTANTSADSRQLLEGLLVALVPSSLGLVGFAILRGPTSGFTSAMVSPLKRLGSTSCACCPACSGLSTSGCGACRAALEPTFLSSCW